MAFRGTLTHRKTRRLAAILKIDPCFALGVLESLWHLTAEQAPQGDIGHMTNQDIADEIYYSQNCDVLISALVEVGFLDKCSIHRLVVHDWEVYTDQATKRKLERHGKVFIKACLDMASQKLDMANVPSGTGTGTGTGKEKEKREKEKPKKRSANGRGSLDELKAFAVEIGLPASDGENLFYRWEGNGWINGKQKIVSYKATMRNWKMLGYMPSQKNQPKPAKPVYIKPIPGTYAGKSDYEPSPEEAKEILEQIKKEVEKRK